MVGGTSCTSPNVTYDAAGRTQKWNGWYFEYDAEGRMTWACQATTACTGGLYNELESTYDAEGHRTQLRQYSAGNATPVSTTDFRYQGDAIVEEKLTDAAHPSGTVVRSYVVDDSGAIVKLSVAAGEPGAGTYLVTWNGHGDATGLWQIDASTGGLTLANSYTYSTWGAPTTATHNGVPDLGFRFLYVGEFDVQWDNALSLGLAYMHARHYSPALGRFLQPDPDGSEINLYAYAANNPVTQTDPSGTCFIICAIVNAVVSVAIYAVTTDSSKWNLGDAAREAVVGAATGFIGVGLLSKIGSLGRIAWRVSGVASRFTSASRTAIAYGTRGARPFANQVRMISRGERVGDIFNEMKALTFKTSREHALISYRGGGRAIVQGGSRGMMLPSGTRRLLAHTHPYNLPALGPSFADRAALGRLGQVHSYLLEHGSITRFGGF